jgi:aminoglycoside phosphotransferase (APT) family kinase protein
MPDHADVREIVAMHLPEQRIDTVVLIGEGEDHIAFEIDRDLIVRRRRSPGPEQLNRESRLLTAVSAVSPVPVPAPVFVDSERGAIAYRKLPGTPLLDLPAQFRTAHATSIAATLGDLLAALHAVPPEQLSELVDVDDLPPGEWLREAAELYPAVAEHLPPPYSKRIEAFLATAPPTGDHPLVFSHNDLGIEHVLVDESGTVTGIIDWSDAALVDPACDYALLFRDLGPAALDVVSAAAAKNADPALLERVTFFARCSVLEDLAYGIETGLTSYAEKSLTGLAWLFPLWPGRADRRP